MKNKLTVPVQRVMEEQFKSKWTGQFKNTTTLPLCKLTAKKVSFDCINLLRKVLTFLYFLIYSLF